MKNRFLFTFLFIGSWCFAQFDTIAIDHLRGISNSGTTFYNVNGVDFTSQIFNYDFTEKNLKKVLRKYKLKNATTSVDDKIDFKNITTASIDKISDSLSQYSTYYFIENPKGRIQVFWFGFYEKVPKSFIKQTIGWVANNSIPSENYDKVSASSINFAGRTIQLDSSCGWININNVQCPYFGQMNWSLHSSLESAKKANHYQLLGTKTKQGGKVISEETVAIEFEGVPTTAKKVIYDFTGVKSLLAGMSGGKTLTIYYVSEKIREHYVSCVMSFWNNDNINSSGLPGLLEQVMKLKTE
ncbi:hypothetical protein [Aquimarina sp. MMG016]|uniref:hypothetical protein n=1 Tax=Aquimarina sp. MMG016 TaxID=2822690 RepID=UPI001B3A4F70|nr:hypothetical protein [Aquimarina sp. MMG016]MBQ4822118.1 hypothetical protein [Aquimarina sp. MMG016]